MRRKPTIRDIAREPGVSDTALSLSVQQSSRGIGFVVIEITNPFYSRMIRSAERIADGLGYEILFAESYGDPHKETRIVSNMIENRIVGILSLSLRKHEREPRPDPAKPPAFDCRGHLSAGLQGVLTSRSLCHTVSDG